MTFFQNKIRTVTFLIIISIILLFVNVLMDKLLLSGNPKIYFSIPVDTINKNFENVIKDLRIEDKWINKKNFNKKEYDSLSFVYDIKVPKDLPMPVLLSEVNLKFDLPFISVKSYEKNVNKHTSLDIFYKNILMLRAELETDTNIYRKSISFAFIIKDIDKLDKNDLEEFLKRPEEFCVILTPSLNAEFIRDKIVENQKEYLVLLNDEIIDQKYKLDENFSKQRLLNSIRETILNFKEAKLYFYDSNSILYKSPVFNFVKNEFRKRKLKLLPVNKLNNLSIEGGTDIMNVFENVLLNKSVSNVFLISIQELNNLQKEIELQRLRGNKLVFPSIKNFGIQP